MLYQFTIYPIECLYKVVYLVLSDVIGNYGTALIFLSLFATFLLRPINSWGARLAAKEKKIQTIMQPQLDRISSESDGAERHARTKRLYQRYAYHPILAMRSAAGPMLQVPFLMAAYYMLESLPNIEGVSWLFLKDLSLPDQLLGGINLLPFLMTAVNLFAAYTTLDFGRREKMQAIVIAGGFLLLLYTAPSALLVYWTCNNLWSLLANLMARLDGANSTLQKARFLLGHYHVPEIGYVIAAFSFTLCLGVPLDIYLKNHKELLFSLRDFFPYLLFAGIAFAALLSAISWLCRGRGRTIFLCLLFGMLLGIFAQSYLNHIQYGLLDGKAIDWSAFRVVARWNTVGWLMGIAIPALLFYKFGERIVYGIAKYTAIVLILVQVLSLGQIAAEQNWSHKIHATLTTEKMFELSANDNIVIFILDAFDTEIFQRIRREHPERLSEFTGFTYYPDAASMFGATHWSVPQMLTGEVYLHDTQYEDFIDKAWKKTKFFDDLHNHGYNRQYLYTWDTLVSANAKFDNLVTDDFTISHDSLYAYCKMVLFRCLPHMAKKYFLVATEDLQHRNCVNNVHAYSWNDKEFYDQLVQEGIHLQHNANSLHWYHLRGAHPPAVIDANVNSIEPNRTLEGQYQQAQGACKIVSEFVKQLKERGIYDRTLFLVLADHGYPPNTIGRAPLVMVKYPKESGGLKVSDNSISYANLHETILSQIGENAPISRESFSEISLLKRIFYLIENPSMVEYSNLHEYEIVGKATDAPSWHKIRNVEPNHRSLRSGGEYVKGSIIDFSKGGNASRYRGEGWLDAGALFRFFGENMPASAYRGGTWTVGTEAVLSFSFSSSVSEDMTLLFLGAPYLSTDIPERHLQIFANGILVDTILLNSKDVKQYKTSIPRECFKNKSRLELLFKIDHPETAVQLERVEFGFDMRKLQIIEALNEGELK